MSAIRVDELRFAYPGSSFRLSASSVRVDEGERLAITGPSGGGKSTLLRLLTGLEEPESGGIEVYGRDLRALSDGQRRAFRISTIGFIAQDLDLLDHLRVEENILLPFYINRALRLSPTVREEAENLARQLGLEGKTRRLPAELSQGERQRVAIARALITKPKLLVADEPTGNLDGQTARQVLDLIAAFLEKSGATFLMITHDLSLLSFFGRRLEVSAGQVREAQ